MKLLAILSDRYGWRLPRRRERLPDRRRGERTEVEFVDAQGNTRRYQVGFGFDRANIIREVFCEAAKSGSDLQDMIHDGCIAMSVALQFGARIGELAKSFSERREETETSGPPASPFGAIARAGAALEAELRGAG